MVRTRKESQSLGRALKADGSFIRHYCRLVVDHFKDSQPEEIKRSFYMNYKASVIVHLGIFNKYFKEEDNLEASCSLSRSQKYAKSLQKPRRRARDEKSEPAQLCRPEKPKQVYPQSTFDPT